MQQQLKNPTKYWTSAERVLRTRQTTTFYHDIKPWCIPIFSAVCSASQERHGRVIKATEKGKYNYQGGEVMLYAERLKRLHVSMKQMDIGDTEPLFTKAHITRVKLDTMKLVDHFKTNKENTSSHTWLGTLQTSHNNASPNC